MSITAQEFADGRDAYEKERRERGKRLGPCYHPGGLSFTPFFDQYFERDMEPVGTVACRQPLRVGATQGGLEVMLLASPLNTENVVFPAGSTITISYLQGDSEDGPFEDVGPTVCVKAPLEGMEAGPCHSLVQLPLPNFKKPWLMVNLEFAGAITGGKLDCILNLAAR